MDLPNDLYSDLDRGRGAVPLVAPHSWAEEVAVNTAEDLVAMQAEDEGRVLGPRGRQFEKAPSVLTLR